MTLAQENLSPFPKFDTHVHAQGPKAELVSILDALNIETILNLSYSNFRTPEALAVFEDELRVDMDRYRSQFRFAPSFSITGLGEPGYADKVISKLERDITQHEAVAVKIWKDLGMMLRDANGHYVFCDDARLTPVYDFIAAKGLVVCSHIADPRAGWMPLDAPSPHANYFRNHPEFHWYNKPDKPSHEEILGHRDALIAQYPNTIFVGAHLASLEHDLGAVAKFLDTFPNARVDVAARFLDLMEKPDDEVRAFFVKYQDRILYGSDWDYDGERLAANPVERTQKHNAWISGYREKFAYFEKRLNLPQEVLRKFYFDNANTLFGRSGNASG